MDGAKILVLESDWGVGGASRKVPRNRPIGPQHTYRDIFRTAASMFGCAVDVAYFTGADGFQVYLDRFNHRGDVKYLVVASHGTRRSVDAPGGRFDPFSQLLDRVNRPKIGVLFAACHLGWGKAVHEGLLGVGRFEWTAAYRTVSHYITGLLTELAFWNYYFKGARYVKTAGDRVRTVMSPGDPVGAAIMTYANVATAVGCRFDVRVMSRGGIASSLEILSHFLMANEIRPGGLKRTAVSEASRRCSERYEELFRKAWGEIWEWQA
jgi:hypothetical protein